MQREFNRLKTENFDLLVCGGGIYGAWTAYDAALRGLKVAIVEKNDWASATSSASSKLVHGGLRYLETLDFKLVKKSLIERGMLLKTAPHRVWPLRFGVPVYENSRLGTIRLKIGLALYDLLAGNIPADETHRHFSKSDFCKRFPYLTQAKLKSGFTYLDAQTDDARFVLELIDGALSAGAVCVNYCQATELIEQNNRVCAAKVLDKLSQEIITVKAKQLVDTTGRWSRDFQQQKSGSRLSKGIHLIMPNVLKTDALLLTAKSDGRVFFLIPWYGLTLLGTTDSNYDGDIDQVPITTEEIHYLLAEANLVLGDVNWTEQDVIGKFSGIRVLAESTKDNPTSISRDWLLVTAPNGLISSLGGKFTSAREDAALLVDAVCKQVSNTTYCQTFGKSFPWFSGIDYQSLTDSMLSDANHLGIDKDSANWLVKRFGDRASQVLQLCQQQPELAKRIKPELPFIMAELSFCAEHEMVIHLTDLLRRRIPLLILATLSRQEVSDFANMVAPILNWDASRTEYEINTCLQHPLQP